MVNEALNVLNGTTGVVYISGDGNSACNTINSLTGYQGAAYIDVISRQISVARLATGGTHAMVGEHGPEMVWLPNGSQVTNAVATESRTRGRRGDAGGIHVHGTLNINVSDANVYGAIRSSIMQGGGW